jgi:Kef-type K+ transport system membrane component KefB
MNATVVLLVVVLFSFVVGHSVSRFASKYVTPSGVEYLLFGLIVCPHLPPHLVTAEELSKLAPFASLVLGLVGFVLGLRVRRSIRDLESGLLGATVAILVFVLVGGTVASVLPWLGWGGGGVLFSWSPIRFGGWVLEISATEQTLYIAATLGAAAAVSSTAINESVLRATRAEGPLTSFSRSMACSASVVAVVLFGLALATGRATESADRLQIGVTEWALVAMAVAVVCGLLFRLFLGRETDPSRIFLASVGAVIFASGIGSALGISPLFVNLLAGVTVGATSTQAEHLREELDRLEHPIFALLMILAGAFWIPTLGWAWALPVVYVVLRLLAWRLIPAGLVRLFVEDGPRVRDLGRAFLGQGTIAVAIGLSAAQREPDVAPIVLTTVLGGVVLSDLFSERQLRAALLDAGEVPPDAPDASEEQPA